MIGSSANVMIIPPTRPWRSVQDFIAAAKAPGAQISFGSVGIGSAVHISAEKFRLAAGIEATHIPYRGGSEVIADILGGRIDFYFCPLATALPLIREGQVRALVVSTPTRATDLPDDVYDIFVIDASGRLRGSVPLGRMLRTKRPVPILDIVDPDIPSLPAMADQAEVAHVFRDKNLVSCPVVDDDGRLLGVIMVDDVVDVIDEEAEEDLLKMGGVGSDDMHADTVRTARLRAPWLLVNVATALVASVVISQFEDTIEKIVVLAALMPIVASMGGNAGIQTVTVTVRALAMGELTAANAMRFISKEAVVGSLNGLLFATLLAAGVILVFHDWRLGAVIAASMVCNLMAAALAGSLIPLGLQKFGVDPAVSSTVFLTMVTDVIGFLTFLGLATIFLL
jgi:magnesium transporter